MSIGYYDYDGLVDAYVNRRQPSGSTAQGRMSFNGSSLYSYSTKITHFDFDNDTILITSRRYSNTTAKQKHRLYNALPAHTRVFTADSLTDSPKSILIGYWNECEYYIEKYTKARSANTINSHKQSAIAAYKSALSYADYANIDKRTKAYRRHLDVFKLLFQHKLLGDN